MSNTIIQNRSSQFKDELDDNNKKEEPRYRLITEINKKLYEIEERK